MGSRQTGAAVVGIVATTVGVVALLLPGVLTAGPIAGPAGRLQAIDPFVFMVVAGVAIGLYLLVAGRIHVDRQETSPAARRFDRALDVPPEVVTADRRMVAAETLDADVAMAIKHGGSHLQEIRAILREAAILIEVDVTGESVDRASGRIDDGEWTDHETAGWFLAESTRDRPPLLARLRLWLRPERERRRRIVETVEAIERRLQDA